MHSTTRTPLLLIAVLIAAVPWFSATAEEVPSGTTLENMQSAFNGESNAHARYLAFAQKADEEGYNTVANLFRAAAKAESIHAANHAEVIKALGAKPLADIAEPEVKSTQENLAAAIVGESYERDKMYPVFLKQARADGDKKAIRSLNFAKAAEAEHASLYQSALDNLEGWKDASTKFYVCPECGKTVTQLDFGKCPVCYTKKKTFITIS